MHKLTVYKFIKIRHAILSVCRCGVVTLLRDEFIERQLFNLGWICYFCNSRKQIYN